MKGLVGFQSSVKRFGMRGFKVVGMKGWRTVFKDLGWTDIFWNEETSKTWFKDLHEGFKVFEMKKGSKTLIKDLGWRVPKLLFKDLGWRALSIWDEEGIKHCDQRLLHAGFNVFAIKHFDQRLGRKGRLKDFGNKKSIRAICPYKRNTK